MTLLLEPLLIRTAATAPAFGVRIVWVVSMMQLGTPKGGMAFDGTGSPTILKKAMDNYMQSKVGGAWLAAEFAKRLGIHRILSVSVHPGLMRTELQRNWPAPVRLIMGIVLKSPIYGAYSELYAGFSPNLKAEHNGGFVTAWGRLADVPEDIAKGSKSKSEGGTGAAAKFLSYCDQEVKAYL